MSSFEIGLRTFLLADATIAGLVSTRCYPTHLPQAPTLPALVYHKITGERTYHSGGADGLAGIRFQIDSYGESVEAAKGLAEAVRKRLSGYKGAAGSTEIYAGFLVDDSDNWDSELQTYRVSQDYTVWHPEDLS